MELITLSTPILEGDRIMYNQNIYTVTESNYQIGNPYFNIDLAVYTITNITTHETFNMFHSTLIHNNAYKL
ncbi:hypothetical protein SAMN05421741_11861 [Paenimyroides ummariense]|uniref:Uncharacterized protein n=1 Tax=Paenimyroides ummariense TaxID=913024 RepID=A0A1I5E2C4_9FLAO|nr:hypothetical protein SAMN05421741_11861 [Paenimyroides ummariense]